MTSIKLFTNELIFLPLPFLNTCMCGWTDRPLLQ